MELLITIIMIATFMLHFSFAQSIKIRNNNGVNQFNISDIDSITFTIIPDSIDLTRGLVAYYPFNGNANDSSGNGNHGTVNGAVLADDHLGNPNSAYFFDGLDDYIDLGNNSILKPQLPVSFSYWIHYVSFGIRLPVLSNNYVTNDTYIGLWGEVNASNHLTIGFGDGGPIGSSSRRSKVSTTTTSTGVWYHLVGIIRGPQDMEIYINGVNDGGTYTGSCGIIAYDNGPGNIGRHDSDNSGPARYYNGRIDELRIYNRELSEHEIQVLFSQ